MLPNNCYIYDMVSGPSSGEYQFKIYFTDSVQAKYVRVDDIVRDPIGNRYRILTWDTHPSLFTNYTQVTTHYLDNDVLPASDPNGDSEVYTDGEVDVRPEIYTAGQIFSIVRDDFENFYYIATFIWESSADASSSVVGDYISDNVGKLYEIISFGTPDRWTDVTLQEVDKEGVTPTGPEAFLFRPTENFNLYFGGKLNSTQLTNLINRDSFLLDHYAGVGELGGGTLAGIFILDAQPVSAEGIVGMKTYKPDTVPEDINLATAVSDTSPVRIHIGMEGGQDNYSPTATISEVEVVLTETSTKRWFTGYADVNIMPGTNLITAVSSVGSTDSVNIELAGAGPDVLDVIFGDYPGSQTELKEDDTIDVTITTEAEAVEVEILMQGANKSNIVLPVTSGTATGQITISNASGNQPITVIAKNDLGTAGTQYTSSNLVLNQTYPNIADIVVTYPTGQLAFNTSESGSFTSTITDFDTVEYVSSHFNITDNTVYNATKNITNIHTGYVGSGTNITITATRAANNATSIKTGLAKIATVAASASISISGDPARLQSSPSGLDYQVIVTPDQELSAAPTLNASIGSWQGVWEQSGDTWVRDLRIIDTDPKGTGTFNTLELTGLSNIVGTQITSGENYTVGGFVSRTITFPAFSRVAPIGTQVADETKTAAQIKGGNVLTRYSDNGDYENGYYIANSDATYNSTGEYLGLSDVDFVGANTSGTLQAVIQEEV